MVTKRVKIPIYYGTLIMIKVDDNFDEVNKKYGTNADNSWAGFVFRHKTKDDIQYIVVFQGKPQGSVIAHECVHLVNHTYIDRLMELDPFNDEPQAYLTSWYYAQIDNFFK